MMDANAPKQLSQAAARRFPNSLPIDILHVSDLHWGWPADAPLGERWSAFLLDVRSRVRDGEFSPSFIAFTGDLVHTPYLLGRRHIHGGVNALLDLAAECGFVEGRPRWKEGETKPPQAWRDLLNSRLFVVLGNHDIFPLGLRIVWQRWTAPWKALSVPTGSERALSADPLAVLLVDSNGKRSALNWARGEVEKPDALGWGLEEPAPDQFRIALMHGHPLQVPFPLKNFDSESLMLVNNAGLLLSNLARLGVRLVLHGHRHYPSLATLSLPDDDGMHPIVVAGAGSITQLPKKWPFYSYNWIRIHPDRRVEVTMAHRGEAKKGFNLDPACLADFGDFRYDLVRKKVVIHERTGDLEISLTIVGFRVLPGRRKVARLPLAINQEDFATYAAHFLQGEGVQWDRDTGSLSIDPPRHWDSPPMDIVLRYYIHNGEALSLWEAKELYGDAESSEGYTDLRPTCQTGAVAFSIVFPKDFATRPTADFRGRVLRVSGTADDEAGRSFSVASGAIEWKSDNCELYAYRERPEPSRTYRTCWRHTDKPDNDELARQLLAIRYWQRKLLDKYSVGQRVFPVLCGWRKGGLCGSPSLG